ncbi:hypothetical protein F5878DRAFT_369021 [Lentinula raphanica]|uniref:Uncharacterized protein n=1 Tax=Lentinula raphanica TaxID=153919 RepID=A0AA38P0V2_9AGAR|nr:hypothetical protein F5880DRAFT_1618730 [Lentinula raphanica]KAJ3834232.1 hypothetical protein F5878DRAFT_369021 [Lentinula raphanica]
MRTLSIILSFPILSTLTATAHPLLSSAATSTTWITFDLLRIQYHSDAVEHFDGKKVIQESAGGLDVLPALIHAPEEVWLLDIYSSKLNAHTGKFDKYLDRQLYGTEPAKATTARYNRYWTKIQHFDPSDKGGILLAEFHVSDHYFQHFWGSIHTVLAEVSTAEIDVLYLYDLLHHLMTRTEVIGPTFASVAQHMLSTYKSYLEVMLEREGTGARGLIMVGSEEETHYNWVLQNVFGHKH